MPGVFPILASQQTQSYQLLWVGTLSLFLLSESVLKKIKKKKKVQLPQAYIVPANCTKLRVIYGLHRVLSYFFLSTSFSIFLSEYFIFPFSPQCIASEPLSSPATQIGVPESELESPKSHLWYFIRQENAEKNFSEVFCSLLHEMWTTASA